ncbi:MAG: GNAT family N-acetyltransferase [Deltaproteobacteria bacterium]|nr:GNAT family N-acetyltransferase [Deltaproteobacteria bacterium]
MDLAPGFRDATVALEPIALEHVDALCAAAVDRSTFGLAPVPRDRAETVAYVERAIADRAGRRAVPYAVRSIASGQIVGSLRFMSLEWWSWPPGPTPAGEPRDPATTPPDVAEIGHAWLAPSAQRTAINTACCRLMMTHAFEVWRVHRLVLKTDARNQRSRDAITRLGGHFEGILRAHLPAADGVIRDTAMFSIVPGEWPAIKARINS